VYETADIRKGLRIELDSEPYAIIEFQFVKPGKGNAFTRTRIRNLINGSVLDRTFKTGEKLKPADTQDRTMQFLYRDEGDGGFQDFVHTENVVLVDTLGRLRGFYDGTDLDEMNALVQDLDFLLTP